MSGWRLAAAGRRLGIDTRRLYDVMARRCVDAAVREQGLDEMCGRLRAIVPDISDQFTAGVGATAYAHLGEAKMRALHAFQMRCLLDAVVHIGGDGLVVADVGDSSGNHGAYIGALAPAVGRLVSVNLDPVAVDKIRAKGGEAVLARAEALDLGGATPDLVCLFEVLEHLTDPARFLHRLAEAHPRAHVLLSVPYRRRSRFGGHHLRLAEADMPETLSAEQVHVYEFSPEDWHLLFRFAGYRAVFSRIYLQYPKRSLLRLAAPLLRGLDFEGFVGVLLVPDGALGRRYAGW